MPARTEDLSDDIPEVDIDLYELLNVQKTATSEEIRSAYRRQALKYHPDKAPADGKEETKEKFLGLALANAVLSDQRRRDRYDATGDTAELLDGDEDFSWRDYFKAQYEDIITLERIVEIKTEYQHSAQERTDLLAAYIDHEGNLDAIFEEIMCSNVLDDEARFRDMIDTAIEASDVPSFSAYTKETMAKKKRRAAAAHGEALEALQMAEEMGIADKLFPFQSNMSGKKGKKVKDDGTDALAAIIKQRQKDQAGFFEQLEAKYADIENKKKTAKKGKPKRDLPEDDEPSEEAFAEMAQRGKNAQETTKRPTKKQKAKN